MKRRYSILIPGVTYILLVLALLVLIFFLRDAGRFTMLLLTAGTVLVVIAAGIHFITGVYLPLTHLLNQSNRLKEGEAITEGGGKKGAEFMQLEENLMGHAERLSQVEEMISGLSEGKTGVKVPVAGSHDKLGDSLGKLRESMMRMNIESQKRRKMDEQQNWASRGLAMFAELFRDADPDPEKLPPAFIRELAGYMDAEMGALFLLHYTIEGKPHYVLKGAHAYDPGEDRKTFDPDEGLVGRCAAGKEALVISDVPEDYIRIRSGLGEGDPATLILVPVVFDAQVLGVIELATFSIVKQYKVEFLKRLANSMGSTLSKMIHRSV